MAAVTGLESAYRLVASGEATSRADLARRLGVAPSTAALRVRGLIEAGLVEEAGEGASSGGRRPLGLRLRRGAAFVGALDLGSRHARVAVVDAARAVRAVATRAIAIETGPEAVLAQAADAAADLAAGLGVTLSGIGVSVPGPVDFEAGAVTSPSRMPGWQSFPVRTWLAARSGLPVTVDNDANLMAYAESVLGSGDPHLIVVKAGSGIGTGVVINGAVFRGATNSSGDISHVRVDAAGDRPCACGNFGCLETVASGAALVADLAAAGLPVAESADVVAQAGQGEALATTAIRGAGAQLGHVLSAVVNFLNPSGVYLGGSLSTSSAFVAAVKSQLYQDCHPLVTEALAIGPTTAGPDGAVLGAALLAFDDLIARRPDLAAARVTA
jgi:predicted NBD/HSP70 family sugar kinase